jgi:hypothetical protein
MDTRQQDVFEFGIKETVDGELSNGRPGGKDADLLS